MPKQTAIKNLTRLVQHLLVVVSCVALIVISIQGFGNASRNTNDLATPAQYMMTISQFMYAALGPCVVVLRFASLRWFRLAWRAWAFFFVATVALIPWAWIAPSYLSTMGFTAVGVVCAGVICFLVSLGTRPNALQNVSTTDA
jgi:cell division protein FtsW (lipid II flippase)